MVQIIVIYEPDEDCVDPKDTHQMGRRHVDVITDGDAIVMWRIPHGDQDGDGHEDLNVVGIGAYENVTIAIANAALGELGETD